MKLFVWANPYGVSYGTSMVFAVAETEDQAREIIQSAPAYTYAEFSGNNVPRNMVLGPPLRVVDCPCAEWHEWSE